MNIVLITIDTVRTDVLGCYGGDRATPHIDAVAENGVLFERAITNGTYTKAAFPAILSSTYAGMHGGPFQAVGSNRPMLAQVLKEQGYQTAGVTSNPLLGANVGYNEGFDRFLEPVPSPEDRRWVSWKGMQRLLSSPLLNRALMGLGLNTAPRPVYVRGETISDLGIEWIEGTSPPFFLWLHYMDAHWPYHDSERLISAESRAGAWKDRRIMWSSRESHPGTNMVSRLTELYGEGVQRLDRQIGRVREMIHRLDLREETLMVIASDHGEAFYEHDRWQHGAVYDFHEEVLHVPLILQAPSLPGGHRVDDLVSLLDLTPTVLDLAGIEPPPDMEGSSLRPVVEGRASSSPLVISEMVDLDWYCVALRTDQFKYIYDERREGSRELFDLLADPAEKQDLYGQRPEVEFEMEVQLQRHLDRIRGEGARGKDGSWQVEGDVVRRLKSLGYVD